MYKLVSINIHKCGSGNRMSKAIDTIKDILPERGPEDDSFTVNGLAEKIDMPWVTVDKYISVLMEIQDFMSTYELDVVGSGSKKVVLLWPRFDLGKMSSKVLDWFLATSFFTEPKKEYATKQAKKILGFDKMKKTPLEEALRRVIAVLLFQDQLSVSEISKRSVLNRRTVSSVLDFILAVQDRVSLFKVNRYDNLIVIESRPDIHELDDARLKILLTSRYLPKESTVQADKEAIITRK